MLLYIKRLVFFCSHLHDIEGSHTVPAVWFEKRSQDHILGSYQLLSGGFLLLGMGDSVHLGEATFVKLSW